MKIKSITQPVIKNEWLSPYQVATNLGISRATIYRYLNLEENPIPSHKISRKKILIKQSELDFWIINHSIQDTIEEEGVEHYE